MMNPIKTLRSETGMTQKQFAEYFEIPKRTIESWEEEQRTCPTYLVKLIDYKLTHEKIKKG